MVVTGCGQDVDHALPDLYDGYVECSAAQVVYHDFLRLAVVQPVGHGRAGRLIDDPLYRKPRDSSGVFRRLPLDVIKIRRHCDDRVGHRLAEEFFRILL